jgi:hypothetical protein
MIFDRLVGRYSRRCVSASHLRVSMHHRRDAECVADALGAFQSRLEQQGELWIVDVVASIGFPPRIMSALKIWLEENDIESATVSFDGRSYLLAGRDVGGRGGAGSVVAELGRTESPEAPPPQPRRQD